MKNKKEPNKILGGRVRELRKMADMTQEELAEKLHFSSKYIGDMENARRSITEQTADAMAMIFEIDANFLLDVNTQYKTSVEKFNTELRTALKKASREHYLMHTAIFALAALNGYDVEVQEFPQGEQVEEVFSKMKEYMIFRRNGKKEFSLSHHDSNRFGNSISEMFMAMLPLVKE